MATTSRQKIDVMDFDPIRPYRDHEVPDVLARISRSSQLAAAAKHLVLPNFLAQRFFAPWLTKLVLQLSVRNLRNVDDVQRLVSKYFEQLVDNSTCLLYTSPSPRDMRRSRMPSSA